MSASKPTVVALAGRRIDALDAAVPRFPLQRSAAVQLELKALFDAERASTLVCSAACGADILALEIALDQGLRTRIVLPFAAELFRTTSVVDRPGDWGERFDRVIRETLQRNDVVDLGLGADTQEAAIAAYDTATRAILHEALELSRAAAADALAVSVWEGKPRASGDATQDFIECAQRAGLRVRSIATLASG
jgi:hypothetical protein